MKTAIFSLIIAISVAILSLLQFDRYQTFVGTTQANLSASEHKTNLILAGFKDELSKLKTAQEAILTQTQNPSFKTAELEYLVRLANTHLLTARDAKAAMELLTLAQTKIQSLNDASLSTLSEAIGKDLNTLQNAALPNVEDLWLQVGKLIDQAATLSPQIITSNAHQQEVTSNSQTQAQKTRPATQQPPNISRLDAWKQRFFESLETIKDFIKIRHSTRAIEPLLSETQKSLIQENFRSLLEQVRLAILTRNDKIYQKTLQDSQQWLSQYYEDTNPIVKEIHNGLVTLSEIQLRPEVPLMTAPDFFNMLR